MYPAYGGANQLWKWAVDNTLVSKMGLVADIKDEKGPSCIGWYPHDGAKQKWQFESNKMKSTMNNLVMTIEERVQGIALASFIQLREDTGNINQKWTLVPPKK